MQTLKRARSTPSGPSSLPLHTLGSVLAGHQPPPPHPHPAHHNPPPPHLQLPPLHPPPSSSSSACSASSSSSTSLQPGSSRGAAASMQQQQQQQFSYQYQATLTNLLQDYLVDLCREYLPFCGNLEIDGVVCLSDGRDLSKQLVLKVHRTLPPLPPIKSSQSPYSSIQRRDSLDSKNEKSWPRRADLPPKEHLPANWQQLLVNKVDPRSIGWPLPSTVHGSTSPAPSLSLSKQGSLYGADAPQDLSVNKDPGKSASSSMTPLSALQNSVEKGPFGTYTKPSALQPASKTPQSNAATVPGNQKVMSLLYQKIMEGPKSSALQTMFKTEGSKPKLSPQNLTPLEVSRENENSPTSDPSPSFSQKDENGKEEPDETDDDPANFEGEMLCKICSETVFGGFHSLQNHTYEVHRRYVCKKCFSTFSLRCNLRRHERLHDGLKPYSCDCCDKTFSRSTDLRMHMQKHASGSQPSNTTSIPCTNCTKTFTNVQNLRWHMYKVHKTQDELWACTICEMLFNDKDEYHKHRECHTKSLNQYHHSSKKVRLDEESGDSQSLDSVKDDEKAMQDEYQRDIMAIDDHPDNISTTSHDEGKDKDSYTAIKQALATKISASQQNGGSSRNKRKRKGLPVKLVANNSESDEEIYDLSTKELKAETMNHSAAMSSPVPSMESDVDPLQRSYNSDILASSSMSHLSQISDMEHADNLQNLQAFSHLRSPLIIEPQDHHSPLLLPRTSEMLYSSHPQSPQSLAQSPHSMNNNVEDLSMSGKATPDRKFDVDQSSLLTTPDDSDDTKDYSCSYDGCVEVVFGFRHYEEHFVSAHSRYPCKLCKQTFSGKNNRTRHMRNHNRAKIYPCPDCGKYFSRPDSMREHRFIHTASYQEDKCRRCGQEFQRKSLLLAHLKNCFRSARTKNGSIDESPYLVDTDRVSSVMKTEMNNSLPMDGSESPMLSLGSGGSVPSPGSPGGPLFNHSVIKSEKSISPLVSKINMVPLNIPKVNLVNENNNETLVAAIAEDLLINKAAMRPAVEEDTAIDMSRGNNAASSAVAVAEQQEEAMEADEADVSGNLVIDTAAGGSGESVAVEGAAASAAATTATA